VRHDQHQRVNIVASGHLRLSRNSLSLTSQYAQPNARPGVTLVGLATRGNPGGATTTLQHCVRFAGTPGTATQSRDTSVTRLAAHTLTNGPHAQAGQSSVHHPYTIRNP
jgi:hypothetical protein